MYDEKKLIKELSRGNHLAFKQLYEHYQERIYYFIYGVLLSQSHTEELFQTVFLKIWENRELLDAEGSFSGYIHKLARNCIYNHLKAMLYEQKLEKNLGKIFPTVDDQLENKLIADDLDSYLNTLIERLPERRKEIFTLHYRQQKTYREISQRLNISENTVDTQIRRVLDFLRAEIVKEFGTIGLVTIFLALPFC